ncbi:HAD-IB family hydrolase [Caulobacter sp. KR2-114]|uniref:HAD-IB family hydrolase n=1 Tax=Caulobacter sp. KR2-114 TaxID=3400912 RepID=UPI003C00181C
MGDAGQDRQTSQTPQGVFRPIVAFDFDGTLTWKDSFMAFLRWRVGARRYAAGMARLAPAAFAYLGHRDRERLKARAVRQFLRGVSRADLEADAQRFAAERARRLLRPDATEVWKRWQRQGARLVIVTASPESIVAPFARGLGAERLIGTRLAFDDHDRVTGGFLSPNCRGPEKVARLKQAFGEDMMLEAAYGDTDGDREMLAMADTPGMRVFAGRPKT